MIKFNFKHNIQKAIDVLDELSNAITQQKKELHQQAADVVKKDIQENVYDEEFKKVVDPNSTWQRLKAELGFPAEPGHFTGSTLNSLIAEATEEIGQVMLKGKWPDKANILESSNKAQITGSGVKIGPFRDDREGIRVGELFIPTEDFETKQYGRWIDEDVTFMKLRPEMEREAVSIVEREINKILARFK